MNTIKPGDIEQIARHAADDQLSECEVCLGDEFYCETHQRGTELCIADAVAHAVLRRVADDLDEYASLFRAVRGLPEQIAATHQARTEAAEAKAIEYRSLLP